MTEQIWIISASGWLLKKGQIFKRSPVILINSLSLSGTLSYALSKIQQKYLMCDLYVFKYQVPSKFWATL